MSIFARHRRVAGGLAAILFLLSNSGFTAVVHYCTMKVSSSAMCCDSFVDGNEAAKGKRGPTGEPTIAAPPADCHATTIVGGVSERLALVEKTSSLHSPRIDARSPIPQCPQSVCTLDSHPSFVGAFLAIPGPLPVEKCILYSSFLI